MTRTSPVHYIAPSAFGITPNCNGSYNDLDVYVARGCKIKVYSKAAGIDTENASYQEWTLKGRNRRLADGTKPYTIYARLPKNDKKSGYLVFAPKNESGDIWTDKYAYVTTDGLNTPSGAVTDSDNWYIRLGDVSLPENGLRTITYDTGILDTDQYNTEWNLDPDVIERIVQENTVTWKDDVYFAASYDGVNHPADDDFDPDTVVVPSTVKAEVSQLLQAFAPVGISVPQSGKTFEYLSRVYYEADKQYHDGGSAYQLPVLYNRSLFPNVVDYYGPEHDETLGFAALKGWLFGMVLAEIRPDLRTAVMKAGYNVGPNKDVYIYKYDFESDPNVARMVASVIYAAMRGRVKPDLAAMRTELGAPAFSYTIAAVDSGSYSTYKDSYYVDLRQFMPSAPGPYLTGYEDRGTVPGIPYGGQGLPDHNLTPDFRVYNTVVRNYNLSNATYRQATAQAIADKESTVAHLFGPNRHGGGYTFHPVFGTDTIGLEISTSGSTASAFDKIGHLGTRNRRWLLDDNYYGRKRPGQGDTDGSSPAEPQGVLVNLDIENSDGTPTGYTDPSAYDAHERSSVKADSYPSGHSARVFSGGLFLVEVMPQKADLLLQAMNQYATDRQITRYHWPSDTIIGRLAGAAIAPVVRASSDYASLLSAARSELNGGGGGSQGTVNLSLSYEIGGYGSCHVDSGETEMGHACTKEAAVDRHPSITVSQRVSFLIEGAGVTTADGRTSGVFEAGQSYLLNCPAVAEGEEKTAKITLSNDNGKRVLYYKLSRSGTHDDGPVAVVTEDVSDGSGWDSGWKRTIEETGIKQGMYLWTRRRTFYSDGRAPTIEYTVSRWGIDGDGISRMDSYYLATDNTDLVITAANDTFPMPGDADWSAAGTKAKWYDTFANAAAANGGVGNMQAWNVWQKTVVIYDARDKATGEIVERPDLINYSCSRIGKDGRIGQEEYYLLSEYNDFEHAFGGTTYDKAGIRWYKPSNPADERWRLSTTMPNICTKASEQVSATTPIWSPVMPAYDKSVHGKKVYLWNFEQSVDGDGTEYATKPVCIGNHARGIIGVRELYALSASGTPRTGGHIPQDIYEANGNSETDYSHSDPTKPKTWTDELYDRAPTDEPELLPYQWNWTRTFYSSQDENGKDYEDHYHVSSVKGTAGEDGAGTEHVYCRPQSHNADGTPLTVTVPDPNILKDKNGTSRTASYIKTHDDFIPYEYTDNPVGIDFTHQVEYMAKRKSSAVMSAGGFTGGHEWGLFSTPEPWSRWGHNGQDGDGVEYAFIRSKTSTAPVIITTADSYTDTAGRTYLDDEFLPKVTGNANIENNGSRYQCTDDPKGVSREWPFEWVVKRSKGSPNAESGVRQWNKYSGTMSMWSNWAVNGLNSVRIDLDNEMDAVSVDSSGRVRFDRTITTKIRIYDGPTKVTTGVSHTMTADSLKLGDRKPTISGPTSGEVTVTWAFMTGDAVTAQQKTLTVSYNGTAYSAVFSLTTGEFSAIYQCSPSPSALSFDWDEVNQEYTPKNVILYYGYTKDEGNGPVYVAQPSSYTIDGKYNIARRAFNKGQWTTWKFATYDTMNAGLSEFTATAAEMCITTATSAGAITDSNIIDREVIPIVRSGKNGTNSVRIDLDNEMDAVSVDSSGRVRFDRTITTKIRIYDGPTKVTTGVSHTMTADSLKLGDRKPTISGPTSGEVTVTWEFMTGDAVTAQQKTLTVSYNGTAYSAVFSLTTGEFSAIYQCSPNPSALSFEWDTANQEYTPKGVPLYYGYTKDEGNGPVFVAQPSSYTIDGKYNIARRAFNKGKWTAWKFATYDTMNAGLSAFTATAAEMCITTATTAGAITDSNIIDREVIPLIRNGKNGDEWTIGSDGYWYKNGVKQDTKAEGTDGTGIAIKGSVATVSAMESDGHVTPVGGSRVQASKGDCYVCDANRHLYMWDGGVWADLGEFKGDPGQSSYMHIAYATDNPLDVTTGNVDSIGFTVNNAGTEYDWWGFCTDHNESDPGRNWSSLTKAQRVAVVNTYKWNYMKGKDGAGVEYIYLLTKDGFTPTIDESGGASGHSDPTKDEFYPKVGNWSSYKTSIYNQRQYWSDDPPASVSADWPILWWAKREQKDGTWNAFGSVSLHNRYSKDGKDGKDGSPGHVGRWYYYAGIYDGTPGHYKMEATQAPYVKYGNDYYMLDFGGGDPPSNGKAWQNPYDGGQTNWSLMTATFKYIISEATFSDYAHLGAFVFNGDWMISTNGTIQGIAYNSSSWKNPATYNNKAAYTYFDPNNPHSGNGFIPNIAIDGLTGKVYMNDAYVKGQIVATSGQVTGTMTIGTKDSSHRSIQLIPADTNGAAIKGYNGNTEAFSLGFKSISDSVMPCLDLGDNNLFRRMLLQLTSGTSSIRMTTTEGTDTNITMARYTDSLKTFTIGISHAGKIVIGATSGCWPTSASSVNAGEAFVDGNGFLKIKLF